MVGGHHQLNEHEFDQTPGDGEGQGSLVCCSPWYHKQSNTTEELNNKEFPGKSAGVDCHFLLQGIFPTQESEPGSPALRADALLSELPGIRLIVNH